MTPKRPDFTGDGGDSIEYAWFVWGRAPNVHILETERCDRTLEFFPDPTTPHASKR